MADEINYPVVLNFTDQGGGHFILQERNSEFAEDGKRYNVCSPRDVILDGKMLFSKDGQKLNETYQILTEKGCRWVFPRGDLSKERDIIWYVTPFFDETSDRFKNSPFYRVIKPLHDKILSQDKVMESMKDRAMEIADKVSEVMSLDLSDMALKKLQQALEAAKSMAKEEAPQQATEAKKSPPK